jgi:hypothetical protein
LDDPREFYRKWDGDNFYLFVCRRALAASLGKAEEAAIAAYRFVDLLGRKYEMFYGKMERFTTLPLVARV